MSGSRKGGLGRGLAALIPNAPEDGPTLGSAAADVIIGKRNDHSANPSSPFNAPRNQPRRGQIDSKPVSRETGLVETGAVYREIDPASISPNPQQPRSVFDEEALEELVHSVREFGLLQPIVVRQTVPGEYQLIMGERRWRASQRAGLAAIPAIVRQTEDNEMLRDALLENIHRVQLNPLEEAAAYQQLLEEFGVSQGELAQKIGRSRPAISNMIRLLGLPTAVQRRVAAGVISAGHARALLSLTHGESAQEEMASRIVAEGMSVRATEEAVMLANRAEPDREKSSTRKRSAIDPYCQSVAHLLADRLETSVSVTMGRKKGKITIEVGSAEDLERVSRLLGIEGSS